MLIIAIIKVINAGQEKVNVIPVILPYKTGDLF